MNAPGNGDPQQDPTTRDPQNPAEEREQAPETQTPSEVADEDGGQAAEATPTPETEAEDIHGDDTGDESDADPNDDPDAYEESTETTYERLPGGGHRVTRRTTRRRVTTMTEDIDEHVVEDLPADAYRAPSAAGRCMAD